MLEELHDNMTAQHQEVKSLNSKETLVSEKLVKNTLFQDFTFKFRHIYHVLEKNYEYDVNRFFKDYISDKNEDITLDTIYLLIDKLKKCGVPVKDINMEDCIFNKK